MMTNFYNIWQSILRKYATKSYGFVCLSHIMLWHYLGKKCLVFSILNAVFSGSMWVALISHF